MDVVTYDALDGDLAAQWDSACGDARFYQSTRWLASVEAVSPAQRHRFVCVIEDDRLVAGAVVDDAGPEETNSFYDIRALIGEQSSGAAWPRTFVGGRRAYDAALVFAADATAAVREQAAEVMSSAIAGPAVAAYVPQRRVADFEALGFCGRKKILLQATASIRASALGWEGYLQGLSRNRRRQVARERERREDSGVISIESLSACADEAGPLLGQLQRARGHSTPDAAATALLRTQAAGLDDFSRVFCLRDTGRLVGFVLYYEWGGRLWGRAAGFDREVASGNFEYFNLAMYEPLQFCFSKGLSGVDLGMGSLRAKCLRGASLEPLWLLSKGVPGLTQAESRNISGLRRDQLSADLPSRAELVIPETDEN